MTAKPFRGFPCEILDLAQRAEAWRGPVLSSLFALHENLSARCPFSVPEKFPLDWDMPRLCGHRMSRIFKRLVPVPKIQNLQTHLTTQPSSLSTGFLPQPQHRVCWDLGNPPSLAPLFLVTERCLFLPSCRPQSLPLFSPRDT